MTPFAIWRAYNDRPGLVDYLTTIRAANIDDAEKEAHAIYEPTGDEELMVEVDDDNDEHGLL